MKSSTSSRSLPTPAFRSFASRTTRSCRARPGKFVGSGRCSASIPSEANARSRFLPHEHLPDFDCSIYIDNSVILKVPPEALIEQYLPASAFCLAEHSFRHSVLGEFLEVEEVGYDDPARLFEQLNHYALELPDILDERPFWTAVLLRDHRNPNVRRMLDIWLAHVQRYSRRDQLSVNFAFERAGLKPKVLHIDNHKSWFHSWPKGTSTRSANFKRLASAFLSHPAARTKELEAALADERRHREAMEAKNQALLSSTSWRMTAPLRNVVKTVRSFRRSAVRKRRAANRSAPKAVSVERAKPAEGYLPPSPENPTAAAFFRDGFIGPIDLFTREQCELILKHYRRGVPPPQPEWPKDLAVRDRFFYEVAKRPAAHLAAQTASRRRYRIVGRERCRARPWPNSHLAHRYRNFCARGPLRDRLGGT